MSKTKMSQLVRWDDGTIATPRQMLDQGRAVVRVVERFQGSPGGPIRRATFIDRVGTESGVEVSGYVEPPQPLTLFAALPEARDLSPKTTKGRYRQFVEPGLFD